MASVWGPTGSSSSSGSSGSPGSMVAIEVSHKGTTKALPLASRNMINTGFLVRKGALLIINLQGSGNLFNLFNLFGGIFGALQRWSY